MRAPFSEIGDPAALHPSRAALVRIFAGEAAAAYGDLSQALQAYRASLAIRERLAAADPSNAEWQRDLFVSYARLGSVLEQSGELAAAAEHYGKGAAIISRLTDRDPSNATWRNDRAWIEQRIAALGGDDGQDGR